MLKEATAWLLRVTLSSAWLMFPFSAYSKFVIMALLLVFRSFLWFQFTELAFRERIAGPKETTAARFGSRFGFFIQNS